MLVVAAGVLVSDRLENKVRPGRTPDAELPGDRYTCTSFTDSLRMEKAVLRRWDFDDMASVDTRTPLYFLYNMNWMRRKLTDFLRVPGVDPAHSYRGMRFVELGPGPSLSVGVLALMAGAEHYDGLEVAEYGFVHDALPYDVLAGLTVADPFFTQRPFESLVTERTGRSIRFDPARINFNPACPAENLGVADKGCAMAPESVHVVFSISVLEHVPDLPLAIERMKAVLLPGGIALHNAVFQDHDTITRPPNGRPIKLYDHLKLSEAAWKAGAVCGGQHCIHKLANQLRPIDVKRLFENAGFEILYYSTTPDTPYETARLKRAEELNGGWLPLDEKDWSEIAPHVKKGHTREEVAEYLVWIVVRKPFAN